MVRLAAAVVLAKVDMLSLLSFEKLQQLRDCMVDRTFAVGATLETAGASASSLYILVRGSVLCARTRFEHSDSNQPAISQQPASHRTVIS